MAPDPSKLAGEIDFRQLIDSLDLAILAVSPEWSLRYHNERAERFLKSNVLVGDSFWKSLSDEFKPCFEEAYKKALLGELNQLEIESTSARRRNSNEEMYEEMPLNMLEQKSISFKFRCHETGNSYSAGLEQNKGNLLIRIDDISERVDAHMQAEKNRQELEQALDRMKEARNAQPLTGLPGNITIQEKLKTYIEEEKKFALIYADLDHFKPFNDRYGFERGNEVLLKLRDILDEALEKYDSSKNFLGHVGGDDFVLITSINQYEPICEYIIERFDRIIPEFYDEDDRTDGGIQTKNRQGEEQTFNFMTISLAVVTTDKRHFDNYLEMSQEAANVKKIAKRNRNKSCYRVDRRSDEDTGATE